MDIDKRDNHQILYILETVVKKAENTNEEVSDIIHNRACQDLSALKMKIRSHYGQLKDKSENLKYTEEAIGNFHEESILLIDGIYEALRSIADELSPAHLLKQFGLIKAMQQHNSDLQKEKRFIVEFINTSLFTSKVPFEYTTQIKLYRIYTNLLMYFNAFLNCKDIKVQIHNDTEQLIFDFINEFPAKNKRVKSNDKNSELYDLLNVIEAMLMLSDGYMDKNSDMKGFIRVKFPFKPIVFNHSLITP